MLKKLMNNDLKKLKQKELLNLELNLKQDIIQNLRVILRLSTSSQRKATLIHNLIQNEVYKILIRRIPWIMK